eukprot:gene24597-30963_t
MSGTVSRRLRHLYISIDMEFLLTRELQSSIMSPTNYQYHLNPFGPLRDSNERAMDASLCCGEKPSWGARRNDHSETTPRTPRHVFTPEQQSLYLLWVCSLGAAITELEGETSYTAGTGGPVSKTPRQVLEVALKHELSPGDKSTSETPSNDACSTPSACFVSESTLCCLSSKSRRNNKYLAPGLMRPFKVLPLPVDKSTDQCLLASSGESSDETPLTLQSTVMHGEAPTIRDPNQAQDLLPSDSY